MKILNIVGARPQFIKASALSRSIRAYNQSNPLDSVFEIIVHTGQHFDDTMSNVFFEQLDIPKPAYNLGISGLDHGAMTGRMLEGIESIIKQEQPDWVLLYGDTNSTLAGALAASKQHLPIAHVEAGLRSYNPAMPEEINRIVTDRLSTLLFCPTQTALDNLIKEGYPHPASASHRQSLQLVGDIMYDATLSCRDHIRRSITLDEWGLRGGQYAL